MLATIVQTDTAVYNFTMIKIMINFWLTYYSTVK